MKLSGRFYVSLYICIEFFEEGPYNSVIKGRRDKE